MAIRNAADDIGKRYSIQPTGNLEGVDAALDAGVERNAAIVDGIGASVSRRTSPTAATNGPEQFAPAPFAINEQTGMVLLPNGEEVKATPGIMVQLASLDGQQVRNLDPTLMEDARQRGFRPWTVERIKARVDATPTNSAFWSSFLSAGKSTLGLQASSIDALIGNDDPSNSWGKAQEAAMDEMSVGQYKAANQRWYQSWDAFMTELGTTLGNVAGNIVGAIPVAAAGAAIGAAGGGGVGGVPTGLFAGATAVSGGAAGFGEGATQFYETAYEAMAKMDPDVLASESPLYREVVASNPGITYDEAIREVAIRGARAAGTTSGALGAVEGMVGGKLAGNVIARMSANKLLRGNTVRAAVEEAAEQAPRSLGRRALGTAGRVAGYSAAGGAGAAATEMGQTMLGQAAGAAYSGVGSTNPMDYMDAEEGIAASQGGFLLGPLAAFGRGRATNAVSEDAAERIQNAIDGSDLSDALGAVRDPNAPASEVAGSEPAAPGQQPADFSQYQTPAVERRGGVLSPEDMAARGRENAAQAPTSNMQPEQIPEVIARLEGLLEQRYGADWESRIDEIAQTPGGRQLIGQLMGLERELAQNPVTAWDRRQRAEVETPEQRDALMEAGQRGLASGRAGGAYDGQRMRPELELTPNAADPAQEPQQAPQAEVDPAQQQFPEFEYGPRNFQLTPNAADPAPQQAPAEPAPVDTATGDMFADQLGPAQRPAPPLNLRERRAAQQQALQERQQQSEAAPAALPQSEASRIEAQILALQRQIPQLEEAIAQRPARDPRRKPMRDALAQAKAQLRQLEGAWQQAKEADAPLPTQQRVSAPAPAAAAPAQVDYEASLVDLESEILDLQDRIAEAPARSPQRKALRDALAQAKQQYAQLNEQWLSAREAAGPTAPAQMGTPEPAAAPAERMPDGRPVGVTPDPVANPEPMAPEEARQRALTQQQRRGQTTAATATQQAATPQAVAAAAQASQQGVSRTTREPDADIAQQIADMVDPATGRDAVFAAEGTRLPGRIPTGAKVQVVARKGVGTLLTTNPKKAKRFKVGRINDEVIADLLGYSESKAQVMAAGTEPVVVQATKGGKVAAEQLASKGGEKAAKKAVTKLAGKGATVTTTTPAAMQERRAEPKSLKRAVPKEPATKPAKKSLKKADRSEDERPAAPAPAPATPTKAQRRAGNYAKRRVTVDGMEVAIETEAGQPRNPAWPPLKHAYGYIRKTMGVDGDQVDVFLGPDLEEFKTVYVVDQIVDGKFDEHKVMLGFDSLDDARRGYLANYAKGWDGMGPVKAMTRAEFKAWVNNEQATTEPVSRLDNDDLTTQEKQAQRIEDVPAAKPAPTGLAELDAAGRVTGAASEVVRTTTTKVGLGRLQAVTLDWEEQARLRDQQRAAKKAGKNTDLLDAALDQFDRMSRALEARVKAAEERLLANPEAARAFERRTRQNEGKAAANVSPLVQTPLTLSEFKGIAQVMRQQAAAELQAQVPPSQSVMRQLLAPIVPQAGAISDGRQWASVLRMVANTSEAQLTTMLVAQDSQAQVYKQLMRGPSEVAWATQRAEREISVPAPKTPAEAAAPRRSPQQVLEQDTEAAKTPRTTEHGSLPKEAVGLVEKWVEQFERGGNKFSLPVHITDIKTMSEMYPLLAVDGSKSARFLRVTNADNVATHYVLAVDWDAYATPQAAIEALAHEYGHMVTVEMYNRASPKERAAIDAAYRTWKEAQRGKTLNNVLRDQLPGYERMALAAGGQVMFDVNVDTYASDFFEWSARNAALYVLDPARPHLSVVEKFFAKVGKIMRKFYQSLTGAPKADGAWADAMDRWIAGSFEVRNRVQYGALSYDHEIYADPNDTQQADPVQQARVRRDREKYIKELEELVESLRPKPDAAKATVAGMAREAVNDVREGKTRDILRTALLSVTSMRQIVSRYEDTPIGVPLRNWMRNQQLRQTTARNSIEVGSRLMGRAHRLDRRVRDALEKVMYLATTNDVHPDVPFTDKRNKHLQSPDPRVLAVNEKRWRHASAIYGAMVKADPDAAEIYAGMRESFLKIHMETLDALEDNLSTLQVSEAARKEMLNRIQNAREQSRNGGPYFPLTRHGDWIVTAKIPGRLLAKEDGRGWATEKEARAEARAQRDMHRGAVVRIEKDKESGEFYVRLTQDAVYFFETEAAAKNARATIEAELADRYEASGLDIGEVTKILEEDGTPMISIPFLKRSDYNADRAVPRQLLGELQALAKEGQVSPEVVAVFEQMAVEALPEHSYRHSLLPRQNILGADKAMLRSYAMRFQGAAHHHATVKYGKAINKAWEDAQKIAREEFPEGRAVLNTLQSAQEAAAERLKPTATNKVMAFITEASSMFSLGFSPAYALTNALQPTMVSLPVLAGMVNKTTGDAVGIATATSYLRKAYKGAIPEFTSRGIADFIAETKALLGERSETKTLEETAQDIIEKFKKTEDEGAMLRTLLARGTLDFSWLNSLDDALRSGAASEKWANLQRMAMAIPQQVETMNRVVTALAAYRLAKDQNLIATTDTVALTDFADQVVADTQLDYSRANRPLAFNKPILSVILQFKLYLQGMYALFAKNAVMAMKRASSVPRLEGETEAEHAARVAQIRKQGRRTISYLLATHAATGGATALGPVAAAAKVGLVLAAAMWGDEEDEWKSGAQLQREFFRDMFGETGGRVADRGLFTLLGVDMADRLQLPMLVDTKFMNISERDSAATGFDKMFLYALGAPYSNARRVWQGANGVINGNPDDMVAGLPTALRNVIRAGRWSHEGVLERDGDVFINRDDLGWKDLTIAGLGLQSTTTSEAYSQRNERKGTMAKIMNSRVALMRQWREGNASQEDIDEFNASVPRQFQINRRQLLESQRSQAKRNAGDLGRDEKAIKEMLGQ